MHDVYEEARFHQKIFTYGLNCSKKFEIAFKMKASMPEMVDSINVFLFADRRDAI